MSYMGVDIGTTGCKAGVFDASGRMLSLAYREYPLESPQSGWAELDSRLVMDRCCEVIREAAAAAGGDRPAALAISCQGEAFTPLDKRGGYLCSAMVSSDARAADLVKPWSEKFGSERLYRISGHTPHTLFTLFKLLWLRDKRPDIWAAADKFYCFEELLQHRLGVQPAISRPLAGRTMLFDVGRHQWSDEILAELRLDAARLAPPVHSGTVVGEIPAAMAAELGLPPGVKIVAGGHDQTCGALGAGVAEPGRAMYATGTVECICPAFREPIFDDVLRTNNVCTYDYTIDGMYASIVYSLTGGNLLRWFRDQLSREEVNEAERTGEDVYGLILAQMPEEPTDLQVLPYFTPSGTPYFDAKLPGAVLGLRLESTRGQLLRGLLEGVAMEMRLNVDILDRAGLAIDEFRAIGGGAKSSVLTQLKADVLGRPITTLEVTEAGCLGAAMLACAADRSETDGKTILQELATTWVKPTSSVEPHAGRASRYAEKFEQYRMLYPALSEIWRGQRADDR